MHRSVTAQWKALVHNKETNNTWLYNPTETTNTSEYTEYTELLQTLEEVDYEIPIDFIEPKYLLTLIRTQNDLNSIISKYWDRDKVYCKLNIINPDLTIKAQDLRYTIWEMEEMFHAY